MESYTIAKKAENPLEVLGVQLHSVDVDQVHEYIEKVITVNEKALVLSINIHCVNLAVKYAWLKEFLNHAQLVFCDGDGVRWGLKMLGIHPPPKITYDRWMWQLAAFAAEKNYRFYFLGARPGVAVSAAERLKLKMPGVQVIGTHDGYFKKQGPENEQVIHSPLWCKTSARSTSVM